MKGLLRLGGTFLIAGAGLLTIMGAEAAFGAGDFPLLLFAAPIVMRPAETENGLYAIYALEQRIWDVIGLEISDGTAEVMKTVIARELMGRESRPY